jgi:predicted ATPase
MSLRSLQLTNLLSFGPDSQPIELGPLNVLIGPNGSGKSNLIEALSLLQAAPTELAQATRTGGGVTHWLWKGAEAPPVAKIRADVALPRSSPVIYELAFSAQLQRFKLNHERIYRLDAKGKNELILFDGTKIRDKQGTFVPVGNGFNVGESVLSQRKDPNRYPDLTKLANLFLRITLYRDWRFGRDTPPRRPQPADLPNSILSNDGQNLGLILNRIRGVPAAKAKLLQNLEFIYEGVKGVDVHVEGGTVQVFLHEHRWTVPATRISDGTMKWLCLLAILLNPASYQRIVCIEEPELGLHPDLIPSLADLLREASGRMQLIVTTHSDLLVDALTETPEVVIVCEKVEGSTAMQRLTRAKLSAWLKKYSLGDLWRKGEIGGNRW